MILQNFGFVKRKICGSEAEGAEKTREKEIILDK